MRERIEYVLRRMVWEKLNIPPPRYEYRIDRGAYVRSYGRIDALYGLTILEYKKPKTLRTRERDRAINKLIEEHILGLLRNEWIKTLIDKETRILATNNRYLV